MKRSVSGAELHRVEGWKDGRTDGLVVWSSDFLLRYLPAPPRAGATAAGSVVSTLKCNNERHRA